jgi:hypothetical protein
MVRKYIVLITLLLILVSGCSFEVQDQKECRAKCYKDVGEWEYKYNVREINGTNVTLCECVI